LRAQQGKGITSSCGTLFGSGSGTGFGSSSKRRDADVHRLIAEGGIYLSRVLNGFFNYFAVSTNSGTINTLAACA
jgi:hypothetical protein